MQFNRIRRFLPWKDEPGVIVVPRGDAPQDPAGDVDDQVWDGQDLEQLVEHRVRVSLEQEDDGAAVDDDSWDHEDQDRHVRRRPRQGQVLYHRLHPRSRTHLEIFFCFNSSSLICFRLFKRIKVCCLQKAFHFQVFSKFFNSCLFFVSSLTLVCLFVFVVL